jgi:Spy/CpxP family protein refolding chaperone
MSKHLIVALGLLAVVGMAAGAVLAADDAPAKDPGVRGPGGGPLAGLASMTDEQKAKIKEIMDAAREDAAKAEGPEAKMKIAKEAFEKVKTAVLTDEQRKKLEEWKEKAKEGHHEAPPAEKPTK